MRAMRPHVTYRGYLITPNAIPYPYKWRWEHEDYDGAPEHSESGSSDFRHGEELMIEDCMDSIDQMEDQP